MSRCRSCQAEIRWARTAGAGKLMPLNAAPDPAGNVTLAGGGPLPVATVHDRNQPALLGFTEDVEWWMPHHATCPQGAAWKDSRRKGGQP